MNCDRINQTAQLREVSWSNLPNERQLYIEEYESKNRFCISGKKVELKITKETKHASSGRNTGRHSRKSDSHGHKRLSYHAMASSLLPASMACSRSSPQAEAHANMALTLYCVERPTSRLDSGRAEDFRAQRCCLPHNSENTIC